MRDSAPSWKAYPYRIGDDPELTFPAAEGDQGAESNTYYVAGRLNGRQSAREYAFLVIFAFNNVRRRLRADFYTFALFDLRTGEYGTYSEFDLPWPPRLWRDYKLSVAEEYLDVRFQSAHGPCTWTAARAPHGVLQPFAYQLSLAGGDARGRRMHVALDLETCKPPMPVGGDELGGVKTCIGQYGTHSYFQSDVRFRGRLEWGDTAEEVDGDCGWIDRQWAPRFFGVHNDRRSRRYRHEWRQIHLDNGWELSVWLQIDRRRGNRPIPFTGATAATPDGCVLATTEVSVERLSFARDPGLVRPRYVLANGPRYLTDRYRVQVPSWQLDVTADPLVSAPAHALPIEYWSGPTLVSGTMQGRIVSGFGFHERTMLFVRDFELVDVLRETLRHVPRTACPPGGPAPSTLADRAWEIDGFLSHGDSRGALDYLNHRLRSDLERLDPSVRAHVLQIAADLAAVLKGRFWNHG
jgi:hypothetical protein